MYFFGCFYRGGGAGELVGLKMTVDLSCYTINRLDEISNVILKWYFCVYSTGFCLLLDFLDTFFDRFNLESHLRQITNESLYQHEN